MRRRAIWCALKYGLLPWWLYEREKHYDGMGYFAHAAMNIAYAWKWATRRETRDDVEFELRVNNSIRYWFGGENPRYRRVD